MSAQPCARCKRAVDSPQLHDAAEHLATSKANVGKAVQRSEARLSIQLFRRAMRAVRLREDGNIYVQVARAECARQKNWRAKKSFILD